MADVFIDSTQLLRLNNSNAIDVGATDIFKSAPLLSKLAATESSNGHKHTYTKYVTAPTVGFRAFNNGVENSMSADIEVTIDLQIADWSFQEDVVKCRSYKKGGVDAFLAREAKRHMSTGLANAEKQIFYGTSAPGVAGGFAGLNDSDHNGLSDPQVVDAGGTVDNTASSCWLIRSVDAYTDVAVVYKDGVINIEPYYQTIMAGSSTGRLDVYRVPILGMMAVQPGGLKSSVRIANLTAETGKGLTDNLIAKALEKFPADALPTHIAMNSRSLFQLRASRTATNANGTPAPIPTEAYGYPIVVTDNIVNTEALLT